MSCPGYAESGNRTPGSRRVIHKLVNPFRTLRLSLLLRPTCRGAIAVAGQAAIGCTGSCSRFADPRPCRTGAHPARRPGAVMLAFALGGAFQCRTHRVDRLRKRCWQTRRPCVASGTWSEGTADRVYRLRTYRTDALLVHQILDEHLDGQIAVIGACVQSDAVVAGQADAWSGHRIEVEIACADVADTAAHKAGPARTEREELVVHQLVRSDGGTHCAG
jgi:hypothetical protein